MPLIMLAVVRSVLREYGEEGLIVFVAALGASVLLCSVALVVLDSIF